MWTRSEENDLVNWYDRGITWFLKRWGLLSLAEDHFWSTRYWRSTSSQHNRTMHRTVMETWVSTSEEEIIKCVTDSLYPSCFAHGDIHSSALLSPSADNCPASNRMLDYIPPKQCCGCAARIHPEECMCSEWFWTPNWEFQGSISVKYLFSLSKKQTRILVQLIWIQNL